MIGSRLFFVAVAWFLTIEVGVTASSWALALFQFAPTVAMMPITLAVVDLVGRRRIVIASDAFRAAVCVVGAGVAAAGHVAAGLLTAVVIVRVFDTLYAPSIRAGVTHAAGGFGRFSPQYMLLLVNSSASLLAPLVVPFATSAPVSVVLLLNGATYLVSMIGCTYGGRLMDADIGEQISVRAALRRWRRTIREGWASFRSVAILRRVVPTLPLIDMAYAAMVVALPALAMNTVHGQSAWYYAVLVLAYGLSRIAGAELSRRFIHRRHDGTLLALNCTLQGTFYLIAAAAPAPWLFVSCLVAIGILSGASTLSVNEIVGDAVPRHTRGRVFALIGFAVVVVIPFGPMISGLASGASPNLTLCVVGTVLVAAGIGPLASRDVWAFRASPDESAR
ncbi:MAG: MFS transporter [Microbacterium sp.]|nr:MFS transporter [Microbacterium sp.]